MSANLSELYKLFSYTFLAQAKKKLYINEFHHRIIIKKQKQQLQKRTKTANHF